MANRGLIVVESPSKIKTIHQIVGNKYVIKATIGHIMEMPKSRLGVDVEDGFKVTLKPLHGKSNVISDLKKAAKEAGEIFLATDPDREGEAIAEHVCGMLPHTKRIHRIMFNAITPSEINHALENPTTINLKRVDAQKARRAIDRLIGYLLSPEASYYMGEKNFSVGRVQSPAVGLIVEREREIANFKPVPYWLLKADYAIKGQSFTAQLKSGRIEDEKEAEELFKKLEAASNHAVKEVEKSEVQKNPMPPFITSTFQRAAFRAYHYDPKFAMELAQQLYQGVEIKGKQVALITYMRTDSTRISKEGMDMAQKQIEKQFGEQYYQRRFYKSAKGAQDAHEAIRPAHPEITPEEVKDSLSEPCYKIYSLIYKRWLASQMKPAVYDKTKATIMSDDIEMEAEGRTLKFEGYLKAYGYDLSEDETDEKEAKLPPLKEGDALTMSEPRCERKETQPPPRYNSGSLVEKLEKLNIGRPSTYATIVDKIQERQYVEELRPKREFKPTERGFRLYDYLKEKRPLVMNYDYTADLEKDLDQIEDGEKDYLTVMEKLFEPLKEVYSNSSGFAVTKPTAKQLDMAKRLSQAVKKEIPESALVNSKELSKWIDETKEKQGKSLVLPPSDKQLSYAERLSKDTGIPITDEMRQSAEKISSFIDTASKILEHNLKMAMHPIKVNYVIDEEQHTKDFGELNIVDIVDEKDKKAVGLKTGVSQMTWIPRSQIVFLSNDILTLKSEWAVSKFIEKKPAPARFGKGKKGTDAKAEKAPAKKTAAKKTAAKKPAAKKTAAKKTAKKA